MEADSRFEKMHTKKGVGLREAGRAREALISEVRLNYCFDENKKKIGCLPWPLTVSRGKLRLSRRLGASPSSVFKVGGAFILQRQSRMM